LTDSFSRVTLVPSLGMASRLELNLEGDEYGEDATVHRAVRGTASAARRPLERKRAREGVSVQVQERQSLDSLCDVVPQQRKR